MAKIPSFLYFTDPHTRGNSPASRLDVFPVTIIKKIRWVINKGIELGVDGIIIGGDILDRPDLSYFILGKLMAVLSVCPVPIYTVLGNHDIYGYNAATFERTALYIFERIGMIKRLSVDNPVLIPKINEHGKPFIVQLTGYDSDYKIDKDGNIDGYINVPENDNAAKIHVVHGFLTNNPSEWEGVPCTSIESVLHTKADILLTGHDHRGFGVIDEAGKTFVNPGALARVTASVGDINLEVKVALIEIFDTERWDVHLIRLPEDIALPWEKVLDRQKLLEEKTHQRQLYQFMRKVNNIKVGTFTFDVYEAFRKLVAECNIEPKVSNIMLAKLQVAEEKIAKERKDKG